MKRKISCWLVTLLTACIALFAVACGGGGTAKATVVEKSQTLVAIRVDETDGNATLYDVLTALRTEGTLQFESENSDYRQSLTSLNGVAAEGTYYWSSYTTDMDNGTESDFIWNGETFYYASFGISSLKVKAGCLYVFEYVSWM